MKTGCQFARVTTLSFGPLRSNTLWKGSRLCFRFAALLPGKGFAGPKAIGSGASTRAKQTNCKAGVRFWLSLAMAYPTSIESSQRKGKW